MLINFKKENGKTLPVFTTRPDTLNAVTFIVIADEKLYNEESKDKIGEFTGEYAIDPLSGKKLPIWKTNYVAPGYGTGNVMGVPAHDERDREFAEKYHLDIVEKDPDESLWAKVEKEGWGKKQTNYHLRDWGISRQRYWGPPIPMINCKTCGWQPVPEADLPVPLPDIQNFKPEGNGTSPLHNAPESWKKVKCPKCGKLAERELDVSDTFLDSSWYFLRYPSIGSETEDKLPFDPEITKKWLPVNAYIGGAEHAVLHLMYARFVTMVLKDLGLVDFEEPFPFLFGHGLIIKDGAKMSKSKGNIVNPDDYIAKFGADALRTYLMFLGPFDQGGDFRDTGIEGMGRFLGRVWRLFGLEVKTQKPEVKIQLHQTIKKVTEDVGNFKYNTAIASIMELVNTIYEHGADVETLKNLCLLLAPFAPHMTEELWVMYLHMPFSIHKAPWPSYEPKYIVQNEATLIIQINGKVRSQMVVENELAQNKEKVERLAKKDEKIAKYLDGVKIKNIIFVSGKILNFVTE
jgi:leucyl-tRNA synthetase